MNISYNWLRDLIEIDLPPTELGEKLTAAGLAVEGIEPVGDDFIFDVDLTSNRSDCLSHRGMAREIGALTNARLKGIETEIPRKAPEDKDLVTILDPDLCHRFTARIIRNVKIAPSPEWLKKRLEAIGERAINNVADITNYVMHELGQPMHSFDLSQLAGGRIIVRRAVAGEKIKTLDEIERKLDPTMLAICDSEKPVAVGGVMGGFDSGITENTTDVLLEVAYFERTSIRQTSRNLNLTTEASYRFERGVDIENLIRASDRATDLICRLAGGEPGEFVDVYPNKIDPIEIQVGDLTYATKRLTGLEVENAGIERILSALGIDKIGETKGGASYTAPTWRHDLAIEEDLVEEVARIVGYEKLETLIPPAIGAGEYQPNELRKQQLRNTLADSGFFETLSYSFIDTKYDELFDFIPNFLPENLNRKFVTIKDPIIEGSTRMRASLLPGLLEAVRVNFNHQRRDLKLFEFGKVFSASEKEGGLPRERELFSIVMTGNEMAAEKATPDRPFDFFDAKGAVETLPRALHTKNFEFAPKEFKHLRKGQSAEISFGGKPVGSIGRLNEALTTQFKFKQPVFVAEVDLRTILEKSEETFLYKPLPVFPGIVRDVSLLLKRSDNFRDLVAEIKNMNFELLTNVQFADIYEGKGVPEDSRSLTLRFEYRSAERTLLEEEVENVHSQILGLLENKFDLKQKL
ncbi:MAG: phenylalanine--tRNA ligase subunit beta [Pyrinomonadaceae bacterium]